MHIKTGYWIRVRSGKVTDVWDYRPSADRLRTEAGWREAVEVFPDIVEHREMLTTHDFNLDVEPAQIVWHKRPVEVEERKAALLDEAKGLFKEAVSAEMSKQLDPLSEVPFSPEALIEARRAFEARAAAIAAATTHDDLDGLVE